MKAKKPAGSPADLPVRGARRDRPTIEQAIERLEREMQKLRQVAERGLSQAEAVEQEAKTYYDAPATKIAGREDPADAFCRIAETVYKAIALEAQLADELRTLKRRRQAAEQPVLAPEKVAREAERAERDAQAALVFKQRIKQDVKRITEQAIKAAARAAERERLLLDLDDRLGEPDIEAIIGERPISAIVALLCQGLGIVPQWRLWANERWAIREARRNVPGSPFVGLGIGLQ
jgi:hypothetical protein